MKDFKDYMRLKTDGESIIEHIYTLLRKDIIIEGIKNFLLYMKANPTEGFVYEENEKFILLIIENYRSMKFSKQNNSLELVSANLPGNIVVLEDFNRKNKRILSFLEFIEEAMIDSKK